MFYEKVKYLTFLADGNRTYSSTECFAKLFESHGLSVGHQNLDPVKGFIDELRHSLQPSDVKTQFENDLSKVGFALWEWRNQGITSITVVEGWVN